MTTAAEYPIDRLFRDPRDTSVLLLDGFGITVSIARGHLLLRDGLGRQRRERRLPRAQRTVRRIVIIGHTGQITFDAIRWCHDVGIVITQLDNDGRLLLTTNPAGKDDARLRRAQAAAANSSVGLDIARALLSAKIDGQGRVAESQLANPKTVSTLYGLREQLTASQALVEMRAVEATAANTYFAAWTSAHVRYARRDADRFPEHWRYFATRRSPINQSSPRTATNPINAMLNYSYALAEAEARIALIALGLDPGLGVVHTDAKSRDSLALDLLEPLRPVADAHVLAILDRRDLTTQDVHETRTGACRLLPNLTHELTDATPDYAAAAAKHAERLTHILASSSPGSIALTTPLSRTNTAKSQVRGRRSAQRAAAHMGDGTTELSFSQQSRTRAPRRTCQQCGTDLYGAARKLCPTCWPVARNEHIRQLGLARAKPHGPKPTIEERSGGVTLQQYRERVVPGLAAVPLAEIERATGLVNSSCSRIKRGNQLPNPKHWAALSALTDHRDEQ